VAAHDAIGEILDHTPDFLQAVPVMKKHPIIVHTVDHTSTRTRPTPCVRAPQLARVVDALLAVERAPLDRRAKVTLALLEKQGALCCPGCGKRFTLEGYRATRTHFGSRETLSCRGCQTGFVVHEQQIV
jgi:hypothetical protein